jgi:hypothetical protein
MRFFRYFDTQSVLTTGHATTPADTLLTQPNDFWNGSWLYVVDEAAAGTVRRISDFANTGGVMTVDAAIASFDTGDAYQIFDRISPHQIHNFINEAIRDGFPAFHETVMNEELIIRKDVRGYSLSGLTQTPWMIHKVWVENPTIINRGFATAGGAATITVPSGIDLTDVAANPTNYRISIFDGTSAGDLRIPSSVSGQQITVSVAWTATPTTSSEFALWDASDETYDWTLIRETKIDNPESPGILYFARRMADREGLRLRIQMSARPGELSADADTTVVPMEFIVLRVLHKVYNTLMNSSRSDRKTNRELASEYLQLSLEYLQDHRFAIPSYALPNSGEFAESMLHYPSDYPFSEGIW